MAKKLTSKKAREILHDKEVHGHPLTDKQRRFFGAIAGGAKPYENGGWMDKYADGGELTGPKDKPVALDDTEIFEHGEDMNTAMGLENGIGPSALTEDGARYAALVGQHAAKTGKKRLVSSDIERAMQTAAVAQQAGNQFLGKNKLTHEVDPILETWNTGVFEGTPKGTFQEPEWVNNPDAVPEGGESFNQFKDRMVEAYHRVKEAPNDEQVIAHSKVTRAFRALNKTGEKWTDKTTKLFLKDVEKGTDTAKDGTAVLKQKGKDNYDKQGNYNDYSISVPPGFVGMGNNLKGRNYSPAWGGQFQNGGNLMPPMAGADQTVPMYMMGGSLPGATGMMYARTVNPAPSNGPYAKKTKASAQNGQEMKYYQQGLDFKPKTISQNGSKTKVTNLNDPRLIAYNDSLNLYNRGKEKLKYWKGHPNATNEELNRMEDQVNKKFPVSRNVDTFGSSMYNMSNLSTIGKGESERRIPMYKKPTQPVVLQAEREPIYTSNPNDPRLRAYQDSLNLYNLYEKNYRDIKKSGKITSEYPYRDFEIAPTVGKINNIDAYISSKKAGAYNRDEIKPITEYSYTADSQDRYIDGQFYPASKDVTSFSHRFKKPVQPVILRELLAERIPAYNTKDLGYNLPTPHEPTLPSLNEYNPDAPTKYAFTYPTFDKDVQKTKYFPSREALKSFIKDVKGATYQEGEDYATATGTLQDGGVVKDDMGYWNPDNWGRVVEIDSNDITMQGVNQPLLGVSDEGDIQYMEPGKDYKFKGKKVKEYPVGRKGVSVNQADQNPTQKLDQLLNFTNYNKPTNGGWLDKYQ